MSYCMKHAYRYDVSCGSTGVTPHCEFCFEVHYRVTPMLWPMFFYRLYTYIVRVDWINQSDNLNRSNSSENEIVYIIRIVRLIQIVQITRIIHVRIIGIYRLIECLDSIRCELSRTLILYLNQNLNKLIQSLTIQSNMQNFNRFGKALCNIEISSSNFAGSLWFAFSRFIAIVYLTIKKKQCLLRTNPPFASMKLILQCSVYFLFWINT